MIILGQTLYNFLYISDSALEKTSSWEQPTNQPINEDLSLVCEFRSYPETDVTWTRNSAGSVKVDTTRSTQGVYHIVTSTLSWSGTGDRKQASGDYKCEGKLRDYPTTTVPSLSYNTNLVVQCKSRNCSYIDTGYVVIYT